MSWSIKAEGLSKRFRLGRGHVQRFDSSYQVLTNKVASITQKILPKPLKKHISLAPEAPKPELQSEHLVLHPSQFIDAPPNEFWALKDLHFEIKEGERVAIVGRNGSGKSTLLKLLSRITAPSSGTFSYKGRLISLLEVGTGFHPDLSGRDNIYLNAQINGITRKEVNRIFDDIVAFSGLGAQLDTPIKRYSSGMYMRLAFSVAAHLESEILIVDEVLAVGDSEFQKKCIQKMLEIGNSGRTLLFVSHDIHAVRKLCPKAIEMRHGKIVSITQTEELAYE